MGKISSAVPVVISMCQVRARGKCQLCFFLLSGKQKNYSEIPQQFCTGVSSASYVTQPSLAAREAGEGLFSFPSCNRRPGQGPSHSLICGWGQRGNEGIRSIKQDGADVKAEWEKMTAQEWG